MPTVTTTKMEPINLGVTKRWVAYFIAALLFGCAAWLTVFPPNRTVVEWGSDGKPSKTTQSPAELGQTVLVLLIAAGGLYLYALNGFRFNRIATSGTSAESENTKRLAEDHYSKSANSAEPVEIESPDENAPRPTEPPLATIPVGNDDISIYDLNTLPTKVLTDMLKHWPASLGHPADMSSFEFASRKKGQGNHPWTIKFRGLQPLTISYGGQGKAAPSINSGES